MVQLMVQVFLGSTLYILCKSLFPFLGRCLRLFEDYKVKVTINFSVIFFSFLEFILFLKVSIIFSLLLLSIKSMFIFKNLSIFFLNLPFFCCFFYIFFSFDWFFYYISLIISTVVFFWTDGIGLILFLIGVCVGYQYGEGIQTSISRNSIMWGFSSLGTNFLFVFL